MEQRISGGEYARAMAKRFAIFVVITLAFPYIVYGAVEISGARRIGGAGGALTMMLGVFLKPIIYLWFAFSTLHISRNRARTIGMSAMCGICVPLLILCDLPFGITFGAFWAVGFTLGILGQSLPFFLLTAVIAAATFSLFNELETPISARAVTLYAIWKSLLYISLVLGLIVLLPTLTLWSFGLGTMHFNQILMKTIYYLRAFLAYPYSLLAAFVAVSTALVLLSRRSSTGGGPDSRRPAPRQDVLFGNRTAPGRPD